MVYPQTGSLLQRKESNEYDSVGGSGQNRTGISLSTMILISVGATTVGAVQSLRINERRAARSLKEVGTDGIIDSAPNQAAEFSGSCERVRYDRLRIAEAFGRGFIHIHSQRIPFDITVTDFFGFDSNQDATIVTTIKNVWITSMSYTYGANDYIITDNMEWTGEAMYSQLVSSSKNVATGGARGLTVYADAIERAADIGQRRGSLDAPGLLNAVYSAF